MKNKGRKEGRNKGKTNKQKQERIENEMNK
jgi:hypothetical protein